MMKKNFLAASVTFGLYLINRRFRTMAGDGAAGYFLRCYFNDIVGSVTFMSLANIVLSLLSIGEIKKLIYIEALLLAAGLFWEYAAPLFRSDTVSDPLDIAAYLLGGTIYWCAVVKTKCIRKENNTLK